MSVDEDSSLCGVVNSSNQLEYCALSRSVRTDDDLGRKVDEMDLFRSCVWAYAKLAGIDFKGNVT
jgi:hypothetical protein